jgi:FKBP-type peptidyl-prolyl cis-trans isomerase SlyD
MKITDGAFVALSYRLNAGEGEEMDLMEEATAENPMTFIFGMGTMIPAFEKNLLGLEKGANFSFSLNPEDAYGDYSEEYIVEVPKSVFEVDGKFDEEMVFEGSILPMQDSNGNRVMGSVLDVKDDTVVLDFNHPLSGEVLSFEGEVLDVHVASLEEIAGLTATSDACDCEDCGDGNGKQTPNCACGCKH